tara:strand:- start:7805 stop:8050 length:246 start_codon:yes stop_codon:yes gene_type:complete
MEIRPLAAKVTANGSGNRTTVSNAKCVYVCSTADDLITNHTTGATMQVHENQALVIRKDKFDELHAGSVNTHFTKIAHPRG